MLFVVLFVGVLLLTATLWLSPRVRIAPPPKSLYLPLGIALLAALLTAPSGGYWAVGGQLGVGVALGALAASLGAWLSGSDSVPWRAKLVSAAPIFVALSVLMLFFRSSLFDALGGLALGWLGVNVLLGASGPGSFLAGTLVAGVGIAGYRAAAGGESAALLLLGAGGLLFSLLPKLWPGWRGLAAFLLLFGLEARWLTLKVLPDAGKLVYAPLIGVALGLLLLWLAKDKRPSPAMSLLLVLAGHVIGSHLGGAYGAALLSVALLVVAGFVGEGVGAAPLALAALLVVYRWLPLRWPELRMGLTDHSAYPGLLVGALIPALTPGTPWVPSPTGSVVPPGGRGEFMSRLAAIGLAAAALVGALVLLGPKAALPLGVGLALAVLIAPSPNNGEPEGEGSPHYWGPGGNLLLALGALFALIQFAGHILPAVEMGRTVRLEVLAGLAVVSAALWATAAPRYRGTGGNDSQ